MFVILDCLCRVSGFSYINIINTHWYSQLYSISFLVKKKRDCYMKPNFCDSLNWEPQSSLWKKVLRLGCWKNFFTQLLYKKSRCEDDSIKVSRLWKGQLGILIFSCLLFVLFEKTNPDIFVWYPSLCYTMVGLGIHCPKILCIQKNSRNWLF